MGCVQNKDEEPQPPRDGIELQGTTQPASAAVKRKSENGSNAAKKTREDLANAEWRKWSHEAAEYKGWRMPTKEEFLRRFDGDRDRMVEFLNVNGVEHDIKVFKPGEIDGYDVTIQNCRNADIYLLDLTSQVQIDDCENCRFFIAPCSGPVFIRNCKSIRVAVVTSQLRLRDCTDAHLMVYVRGRSAIESCKRISLCCWNVGYFQLPLLMARSGLSVFDNGWRRFDDFGTHSAPHFLPMSTTLDELMRFPKVEARAGLTPPSPGLDPEADSTASVNNNDHISNVPWRTLAEVAPDCFGQEGEEGLLNPVARVTGEKEADEFVFALFSPSLVHGVSALSTLPQRKDVFGRGPLIGLLIARDGGGETPLSDLVSETLKESFPDLCTIDAQDGVVRGEASDLLSGQVCLWSNRDDALQKSGFFVNELKGSLDG